MVADVALQWIPARIHSVVAGRGEEENPVVAVSHEVGHHRVEPDSLASTPGRCANTAYRVQVTERAVLALLDAKKVTISATSCGSVGRSNGISGKTSCHRLLSPNLISASFS